MKISKSYGPGILFILISLVFGITALLEYEIGKFSKPGPALFPLVISGMLFFIGIVSLMSNLKLGNSTANLDLRTLGIVSLSLVLFGVISQFLNMAIGLIALVGLVTLAVKDSSKNVTTIVKLIIGLEIGAILFRYALGVNIPLWN